ncbi:hypothetical protein ACHAPT_009160 [Fusarium lateritium]
MDPTDSVSRADLLRCRFDRKLQDSANITLSWRPFGYIEKGMVEPELWPQLETEYTRKYHSFTWYIRKKPISDKGFRRCSGRTVRDVPDDLEMRTSAKHSEENGQAINIRPSKQSTRTMMSLLVEDFASGRGWANAGLSTKREQLRWFRDWEGLDTMETPMVGPAEEPAKPPSWFLKEWINDRYG